MFTIMLLFSEYSYDKDGDRVSEVARRRGESRLS